ncbi:metallophosphoesterase [Negadavirga shengliensis]|uniref:Metallophosphoesterase n=1 Tax=Negadavirga shengliensis TaxID=1389218 RepID=A0ABV9SX24_9BACT
MGQYLNYIVFTLVTFTVSIDLQSQTLRLVVVPDTQSALESCPEIMEKQFYWMGDNTSDIDFILHVGDVTQSNTPAEWALAWKYFEPVRGKVPYAISLGNHDFGSGRDKYADNRDSRLANKYFPLEKLKDHTPVRGAFEEGKIDNIYHTVEKEGVSWLVLALEFGPRDAVISWANEVVADHPEHKVILLTHAYMYVGDKRMDRGADWNPHNYGIGKLSGEEATNDGEEIWEKLVNVHDNFFMVFSGHVLHEGVGRLISETKQGNKVYQFLANYQRGVKGYGEGCNGYLRLVDVDLAREKISIKTYSPWLEEYLDDPNNQFEIKINKQQ